MGGGGGGGGGEGDYGRVVAGEGWGCLHVLMDRKDGRRDKMNELISIYIYILEDLCNYVTM